MKRLRRDCLAFRLLPVSALFMLPSVAAADGGTLQLSEQKGNYQITVFTTPTVLRAGPMDINVLVQEVATGELASNVEVTIKVVRSGSPGIALRHRATNESATNKLYYAATFDLPEPGWHSVEVFVEGVSGKAPVCFELEVAEPLPSWLAMLPWVGWPVLVILLFSIHQLLVRCRFR